MMTLSAVPTTWSCAQIYLWIRDTSVPNSDTASSVPMVSAIERFHCICTLVGVPHSWVSVQWGTPQSYIASIIQLYNTRSWHMYIHIILYIIYKLLYYSIHGICIIVKLAYCTYALYTLLYNHIITVVNILLPDAPSSLVRIHFVKCWFESFCKSTKLRLQYRLH